MASVMRPGRIGALAPIVLAFVAADATAQCFAEPLPWDAQAGARHGSAVAVAGDVVVVGAPGAVQPGLGVAGAVTVSRRVVDVWLSAPLASPPLLGTRDGFGHAVAIDASATWIAVGAPDNDTGAEDGGLVALYAWNPAATAFEFADAWYGLEPGARSGWSVDLDGDLLLIGKPFADGGAGSAEVRRRDAAGVYRFETSLTGTGSSLGAHCGWSVAVSGDRIAVGSPFETGQFPYEGLVDTFQWDGSRWNHHLTVSGGFFGFQGWSVGLRGDWLVVGRPQFGPAAAGPGFAEIYNWSGIPTYGYSSEGKGDRSGQAVAIDDARVVIASPGADGFLGTMLGADAGLVAVRALEFGAPYEHQLQLVGPSQPSHGDQFGWSVAVDGRWLVVGVPFDDDAGTDAGAALVYELSVSGEHVNLGHGLAGSGDLTPVLISSGVLCDQTAVWITLDDALPYSFAFFVAGVSDASLPFKGGVLVPDPIVVVGPHQVTTTGEAFLRFVWPPGPLSTTLILQAWVMDPQGPAGWSASHAVALVSNDG